MADHGSGLGEVGGTVCGRKPSRTGMARVCGNLRLSGGWVGRSPSAPSVWEWNGSQPGKGAADLLLPRPVLGQIQGEPARRSG